MDTQEIRQKLKSSVDMVHVRIHLTIYVCLLLFGAVLGRFHPNYRYTFSTFPIAIVTTGLCGLVVLIPALKILLSIFREPASYRFYRATLSQPHGGFPRGWMYFTVVLEDPDGHRFLVNTNTIFQSYGTSMGPSIEDYVNQAVTIAYNEETGSVVVIG